MGEGQGPEAPARPALPPPNQYKQTGAGGPKACLPQPYGQAKGLPTGLPGAP